MLTKASLAVETKGLLFLWLVHLNNKSNVCKQISSLFRRYHNVFVGREVDFIIGHVTVTKPHEVNHSTDEDVVIASKYFGLILIALSQNLFWIKIVSGDV